jgi:hypothetical protein
MLFIGVLDRIIKGKVSNLFLIHNRFYLAKICKRINGEDFRLDAPGMRCCPVRPVAEASAGPREKKEGLAGWAESAGDRVYAHDHRKNWKRLSILQSH